MAVVINMPRLSDTMTEGVVAKWHKKVGDQINEGDLLAEIETDKATMDFEAFPGQEGELLYIGVQEGQTAPVDQVLAILGSKGEDVEALLKFHGSATPAAEEKASSAPVQTDIKSETPAPAAVSAPAPVSTGRVFASPLAKKLAEEKGVDISSIPGSGEGGRVVKRDVDNYKASGSHAAPAVVGAQTYTDTPVSQMRKTIARRLADSKFTAPHFYLNVSVNMDNAMAARAAVNAKSDVKISFNDFVVKAVSLALKKNPKINSGWFGDYIRQYDYVNIGIAVAVDEGLLVPVVRNADLKSLATISGEVKTFAQKAKDKKLQPSDWEGNTFTISNLGMFGIDDFTAIINPPDACILAVGGIQNIPVVKHGQVVPGNVMKLTLSCDHRVVDGATGATFLNDVKSFLEEPLSMLL